MGIASLILNQVIDDLTGVASTFDISTFRSELNALGGVMRTNMFQVEIAVPPFLSNIDSRTLTFFCMATNLPGINLVAKQVQRYGYGPLEKMPFGFDNADISLNFIGDADGVILNFFNDWMRGAVEVSSDSGPNSPVQGRPNQSAPMNPYLVNYKENYQSEVSINVFDSTGNNLAYNVNLNNAFPISVGEIYLNWGNLDNFMIIPVRFSFVDTSYSTNGPGGLLQLVSNGLSYLENYVGGQIATSTLSQTVDATSSSISGITSTPLSPLPGFPVSSNYNQGISFTQ